MALARLSELREKYGTGRRTLPAAVEAELRADPRAGARALLESIDRVRRDRRAEGQRLRKLLRYERALWEQGVVHVAGVDEAGMSPLAGPVAAAAVIFPPETRIVGIDDSKKLTAEAREELAPRIREAAVAWAVAFVDAQEIDVINIYWAGILAMRRAVEALSVRAQHLLIDARRIQELDVPQQRIIKGDAKSQSIAAASILAKTTRDARMVELDAEYPGYGFAQHKGYPVRAHQDAITRLGICAIHRRSYPRVLELDASRATKTTSGPDPSHDAG